MKGSLDFMQHFKFVNWRIGESENSFFDVTNRLLVTSKQSGRFSNFCGLLRIFELYVSHTLLHPQKIVSKLNSNEVLVNQWPFKVFKFLFIQLQVFCFVTSWGDKNQSFVKKKFQWIQFNTIWTKISQIASMDSIFKPAIEF